MVCGGAITSLPSPAELAPAHDNLLRCFALAHASFAEVRALVGSAAWLSPSPTPRLGPGPDCPAPAGPSHGHVHGPRCLAEARGSLQGALEALAAVAEEGQQLQVLVTEWCDGGDLRSHIRRLQQQARRSHASSRRPLPVSLLPSPSPQPHAQPQPAVAAPPRPISLPTSPVSPAPLFRTAGSPRVGSPVSGPVGQGAASASTSLYGGSPPPAPSRLPSAGSGPGLSWAGPGLDRLAAVQAALDVARGVAALHAAGLTHGRLEPRTVLCASFPHARAEVPAAREELEAARLSQTAPAGSSARSLASAPLPLTAPGDGPASPVQGYSAELESGSGVPPRISRSQPGGPQQTSGGAGAAAAAPSPAEAATAAPAAGPVAAPAVAPVLAGSPQHSTALGRLFGASARQPLGVTVPTTAATAAIIPGVQAVATASLAPVGAQVQQGGGRQGAPRWSSSQLSVGYSAVTSTTVDRFNYTPTVSMAGTYARQSSSQADASAHGGNAAGVHTSRTVPYAVPALYGTSPGALVQIGPVSGAGELPDNAAATAAARAAAASASAAATTQPQTQPTGAPSRRPPALAAFTLKLALRAPTPLSSPDASGSTAVPPPLAAALGPWGGDPGIALGALPAVSTSRWRALAYAAPEAVRALAATLGALGAKTAVAGGGGAGGSSGGVEAEAVAVVLQGVGTGARGDGDEGVQAAAGPGSPGAGAPPVGPAADVYSLGALLWQLVSGGRPPHYERHPAQILMGLLSGDLDLALKWPEDVDPELAELGRACMRREPDSRPSAQEVVDGLSAALSRLR
ncbi:hypothetical protein HYH03_017713 [Edaphochlamys debaryana]|uniref:Serine-threonine/tyrosine-protein kinase catalytic domain-containing protein n=1 Tax=Edaphochlamys debaryana TaxID=47281 RepID=A0A835XHE8_9CHLO|nr:hypothetical protein HYH03_017713 [Edaphochlamys debaryana]|eukprot:KAG2483405.1 hypothetical protein HYH03_017713 [Edaphochlamys debaryana]